MTTYTLEIPGMSDRLWVEVSQTSGDIVLNISEPPHGLRTYYIRSQMETWIATLCTALCESRDIGAGK